MTYDRVLRTRDFSPKWCSNEYEMKVLRTIGGVVTIRGWLSWSPFQYCGVELKIHQLISNFSFRLHAKTFKIRLAHSYDH
jgi:hypothetical protein